MHPWAAASPKGGKSPPVTGEPFKGHPFAGNALVEPRRPDRTHRRALFARPTPEVAGARRAAGGEPAA